VALARELWERQLPHLRRQLAALRQAHVCGLSPQVYDSLVRPGPRMGEAAQALVQCLQALPVRAGTLSR
jgi:iron complex transport system substrate-binding protein